MLNGQHPVLGAEPSKGVEERLLSILHQFQQEQVQRQQRPKHQRSSSLFAGSPASDHQRSMSNCMPPFSRSGSLIPPACATPLAVPLKAPSTTSAPDIPTTTASSIAAAPAPATNQPPPNSHAIGQVRLNTNLSRSSGHARSILTGSNDSIPHDSVLAHAPSDSSACMAGSTHCSKLGTMAKDTSILAGAESSLLARLPAHPPRSSSSTALTGKGSGDAFGSADRPPCPSVPSVSPPASGLACNGCAFTVGSGSPGSPHQRTPSLLLQQLHVRTPSLGNMSNSSSVASGLHGLSGKGGPLDSTLSSPRRGASQIADTVPPPPGAAKVEAPSEVDPQPSSQATGHGSWAPWLTANTSTLPMPQPPAPTATLPQQQQQHRRVLSTCAALLTGAWDAPAVQQLDQQQQQQQQQAQQHEGQSQQPEQPRQQGLSATVQHQDLSEQQPLSRGSSSAATTVYRDSLQPPSHKEQQQGLFGLLHAAATAAAAAAAAHEQRQRSTLTSISTSPLPSMASSEPALSPTTPPSHMQQQQQQHSHDSNLATPAALTQQQQEEEHEEQLQLQLQQEQEQEQEQQEQEWQKLQQQQEQLQVAQEQQDLRRKHAPPCSTPPSTPPARLATPPPLDPEPSQVTTPTRPSQNKAQTLHSVQLGPEARSPLYGVQQHAPAQGSPHNRSATHTPYRPPLTPIASSEQDELSSPVPGPIPAESPTHLHRRTSATYSSHSTHAVGSLGHRSLQLGGVDLSSPSILQQHQPHSHAGGSSTSSSRPHSRRTTSTSGVGSLYSREEGEGGRRSVRDARDRRYYTSSEEHPMGHPQHSRSSSSMATMPLSACGAPSNASSRMATNAATQRHRVPAAPVGTTAAVAAVTGRPNSEAATTPITSTAVMMGGFNAISHARVRSIDLATDMLLGGGRSGRNSEHSSHGSRLQHHSGHTQH